MADFFGQVLRLLLDNRRIERVAGWGRFALCEVFREEGGRFWYAEVCCLLLGYQQT